MELDIQSSRRTCRQLKSLQGRGKVHRTEELVIDDLETENNVKYSKNSAGRGCFGEVEGGCPKSRRGILGRGETAKTDGQYILNGPSCSEQAGYDDFDHTKHG